MSDSLTAARQASLSFTISQRLLKRTSIELVVPSNHFILHHPSFPQSLLASGSFPVSQLFTAGGQSIWASTSASVLPVNIQGLFPWGLTSLISLLSKGLSRVFSSTTIGKHQFFSAQPFLWSNSHMITGKTIALTIQNLFSTIHEFVLFNGLLSFAIIICFDAQIVQKWARIPFMLMSVSLNFYPWFPECFITFWPKDVSSSPHSGTLLAQLRKQPFSKKPVVPFSGE